MSSLVASNLYCARVVEVHKGKTGEFCPTYIMVKRHKSVYVSKTCARLLKRTAQTTFENFERSSALGTLST